MFFSPLLRIVPVLGFNILFLIFDINYYYIFLLYFIMFFEWFYLSKLDKRKRNNLHEKLQGGKWLKWFFPIIFLYTASGDIRFGEKRTPPYTFMEKISFFRGGSGIIIIGLIFYAIIVIQILDWGEEFKRFENKDK